MHDVAAERSHAGAAAYEDVLHILGIVLRKEEFPVRAADHHFVALLAGEDIGGGDSRRNTRNELEHALRLGAVERRGGDTYVQLDDVLLGRIRGHRVGADRRFRVLEPQRGDAVFLPVAHVDGIDAHVGEVGLVLRNVDLDVLAGLEVDVLAFRETDGEFLDEGGDVLVGDDFALELLDAEGALRNGDLEVVLDLDLAAQAPAFLDLLAGEETGLGGQNGSAAFDDLQLALSAVGLAAAGGRQEDAVIGEGVHQVAAGRDFQFLGAAVDGDLDGTGRGEGGLDPEEQGHEDQRDDGHHDDGEKKCICHSAFLRIKGLHP